MIKKLLNFKSFIICRKLRSIIPICKEISHYKNNTPKFKIILYSVYTSFTESRLYKNMFGFFKNFFNKLGFYKLQKFKNYKYT